MIHNLDEFIEQLGRELYSNLAAYQQAVPELVDMNYHGSTIQSCYKLDGTRGRQGKPDKTVVLSKCPLVLIEHGDRAYNLITWLMQRRGWEFMDTLKYLVSLVGMEMPEVSKEAAQRWKERAERRDIMETMQEYFVWCLHNAPTAQSEWQYLDDRFTRAEVAAMGLGYIPSQQQLVDYLKGKNYTQEQIDTAILKREEPDDRGSYERLPRVVGNSHKIVFPIYRAGQLYSFKFRCAGEPQEDANGRKRLRYYNVKTRNNREQTNLQFDYIPSKVYPAEPLVIVEGHADALHMGAAGIKNVVCSGTNNINREAVKDAVKRGARKLVLMYDADADPTNTTNYRNYSRAIDTILDALKEIHKGKEVSLYVAVLPQQDHSVKVDPDSYLKQYGVESLRSVIANAQKYWLYNMNHAVEPYQGQEVSAMVWDSVKEDILDTYDSVEDAIDRDQAAQNIVAIFAIENRALLDKMLAERKAEKDKAEVARQLKELAQQYAAAVEGQNSIKADSIQAQIQQLRNAGAVEDDYTTTTNPTKKEDIVGGLHSGKDDIYTGLFLGKKSKSTEIVLPAGAVSIIAAATSHGKTTVLLSMAVDAAKRNPGKEYYFFSYEEAQTAITLKAISSYAGVPLGNDGNTETIKHYMVSGEWNGYADRLEDYKKAEQEYFDMLAEHRLTIKYTEMDCQTLCAVIRRLAEERNVGGVFIDYIQYLSLGGNGYKPWSRADELQKICRELKATAVDTELPLVLGAQFNRQVTDPTQLHANKIGEAGDIERIAALVIGFWNNGKKYEAESIDHDVLRAITSGNIYDAENPHKHQDSLTVQILKNRNGAGAKAGDYGQLYFNGNTKRVEYRETAQPAAPIDNQASNDDIAEF